MNIRHPMGFLHSFCIKNVFYDKTGFFILMWRCVQSKEIKQNWTGTKKL